MNGEVHKLLDEEILSNLHAELGESLAPIVELYLTDVPQNLRDMRQAMLANDFATVHRIAHALKASSANLGALQTSSLAADLEQSINSGEIEPDVIAHSIDSIAQSFDQIRTTLQNKRF